MDAKSLNIRIQDKQKQIPKVTAVGFMLWSVTDVLLNGVLALDLAK